MKQKILVMKIEITPDTLDVANMWIHVTTSLKPSRPSHSYNVKMSDVGPTITAIFDRIAKYNQTCE